MADRRPRLADRVSAARRRNFVGRTAELELFRQVVEAVGEPPFTVLHVHGAGGIGKTALLRMYRELATDAGADVLELDGRDLPLDRDAIGAAVAPTADSPRRVVLLVDSYASPRDYFRAAARALAPAWDMATGADLQDPRVEGPRSRAGRLINVYLDRLQEAAQYDAGLGHAFLSVSSLLEPPPTLMRPDRVARVFWSSLRHRRGSATRPLVAAG